MIYCQPKRPGALFCITSNTLLPKGELFRLVLPKPQGHIGVSIKEGAGACYLFLANAPDSERRYRPEAHGSAQKALLIKALINPLLLSYPLPIHLPIHIFR